MKSAQSQMWANINKVTHWPKLKPYRFILRGFAVLFTTGETEYWKYDPSVLNKKQLKTLGVLKWKPFRVVIK